MIQRRLSRTAGLLLLCRARRRKLRRGADRSAAVLERRPRQEGHRRLREDHDDARQSPVRSARRAHRHVRPGRNALGRAPGLLAVHVHPGPRSCGREGEAGARQRRALQDGDVGQSRGHREAPDGGHREARGRDADRDVGRRLHRGSHEVGGRGQGRALEAALHGADLSADAGGPEVSPRQRLQDLHRHGRRPGLRPHLLRAGLRHPARAGRRNRGRHQVRLRQGRPSVPDQGSRRSS